MEDEHVTRFSATNNRIRGMSLTTGKVSRQLARSAITNQHTPALQRYHDCDGDENFVTDVLKHFKILTLTKATKLGNIWTFEYASNNFSSTLVGYITHRISQSFDRVPFSSHTRFCVFVKEKHVAEHSCSLCMWYLGSRGQCINQYIHNTGNLFTVLSYTGGGEERQALHPKVLVTYHVQPSHHSTNTTKANLYPSFANVPPHFFNLLDAPFWVHENCRFLRPKLLTLNTLT